MNPNHRIVFRCPADLYGFMRQVGQLQHQLTARRIALRRLPVQCGDAITQIARFRLFRLSFGGFLLAHQRADFLRRAVALGLEHFDLGQELASLLVEFEQFVNVSFIPCPARGESLADKIRLVANQFNVEHREIIGVKSSAARWKAAGKPTVENMDPLVKHQNQ